MFETFLALNKSREFSSGVKIKEPHRYYDITVTRYGIAGRISPIREAMIELSREGGWHLDTTILIPNLFGIIPLGRARSFKAGELNPFSAPVAPLEDRQDVLRALNALTRRDSR